MLAWLAYPISMREGRGPTTLVAGSLRHAEALADARGLELDWQINGADHAPDRTPTEEPEMLPRVRAASRRHRRDRQLIRQGWERCRICKVVEHPSNFDADLAACDDCVRRACGMVQDPVDGWTYEGRP